MANGTQITPTRSAYLELKHERQLIQEGYVFLDEKRMIVAQELLRQLNAYRESVAAYRSSHAQAVAALAAATARDGLEGVSVYPRLALEAWADHQRCHRFLGVELIDPRDPEMDWGPLLQPAMPSPEAIRCRDRFVALLPLAAELAARAANMRRLIDEYVRTERRARALENVLLPEIGDNIRFMEEQLEAIDQEEALRVRFVGHRRGQGAFS